MPSSQQDGTGKNKKTSSQNRTESSKSLSSSTDNVPGGYM
jgi:hypothetical protein